MSSIFSKIIQRDIPAYIIKEDDSHLAFLDASPIAEGHTLVIPKKEVDVIYDMDSEAFKSLWDFAQKVAKNLETAIPCNRVGIAVVGLEVPHAHIHLVPINTVEDLSFTKERLDLTPEQYKSIQNKIVNSAIAE